MQSQNPRQKLTTDIIYLSGVGAILMKDLTMRGVQVAAMFVYEDWHFIIHHDIEFPDHYTVTEASTGMSVSEYCYPTPLEAFEVAQGYIEKKKMYLSTTTGRWLVKHQTNLFRHNSCIIPLIDFLWS